MRLKNNQETNLKQKGTNFWDLNPCGGQWASYQEFFNWYQQTEPYILESFDKYRWKNKKVLAVGCGQGFIANYLAEQTSPIIAVDISLDSLLRAKAGTKELGNMDKIQFDLSNAENLPFRNAYFEVVVCLGVLHHTPDTLKGISEIFRTQRKGGSSFVMLYRSGNPKWLVVKTIRNIAGLYKKITGKPRITQIKGEQNVWDHKGTAINELLDVPIMKAFSNKQVKLMFNKFKVVKIINCQPGFKRLKDFLSFLRPFEKILEWVDIKVKKKWGFYQVIIAEK
ncbi:MAG TPA: class I SAM-dependent methyltransferase [Anaerolineae bacterium]|nr:class I SAM-dependent methyltransferase [Anaerolineae bacterium]